MRCRRLQGGDSGSDVDRGVLEHMLNRLDSSSHRRNSYIEDHSLSHCIGNRVPSNRNQYELYEIKSRTKISAITVVTVLSADFSTPHLQKASQ